MSPFLGDDGSTTRTSLLEVSPRLTRDGGDLWRPGTETPWEDQPDVSIWRAAPGVAVAVPQHYTPGYAYPTLVWLADGDEGVESSDWLRAISPRNHIAIGLRVDLYRTIRTGSPDDRGTLDPVRGLARLAAVLRTVRTRLNLHPERLYLAARGGATGTALAWLCRRPERFAGAVIMEPALRESTGLRSLCGRLHHTRVLWMSRDIDDDARRSAERLALQCLGAAIKEVALLPDDSPEEIGLTIDRWILSAIPSAVLY